MKVNLEIDISTGDKVTPRELRYKYPLVFEDKQIIINCYNIETILSEKIETILRRGIYNSRMKDYYDIYMFLTKMKSEINMDNFMLAMKNTFEKRDSLKYLEDYSNILNEIKEYDRIYILWDKYIAKREYAQNIKFGDILSLLLDFLNSNNILVAN